MSEPTENMHRRAEAVSDDLGRLAEDAGALMAATAGVAGDEVEQARRRVAAALEHCRRYYGHVRQQAVEGGRAADAAIHRHPYKSIAIGVGLGALLGFLLARRRPRSEH